MSIKINYIHLKKWEWNIYSLLSKRPKTMSLSWAPEWSITMSHVNFLRQSLPTVLHGWFPCITFFSPPDPPSTSYPPSTRKKPYLRKALSNFPTFSDSPLSENLQHLPSRLCNLTTGWYHSEGPFTIAILCDLYICLNYFLSVILLLPPQFVSFLKTRTILRILLSSLYYLTQVHGCPK